MAIEVIGGPRLYALLLATDRKHFTGRHEQAC